MQDRTINNALLALRQGGGSQGMLAEVLLDMRSVDVPCVRQYRPARRGVTAKTVLAALRDGPKTANSIAAVIHDKLPDISRRAAYNRGYQAVLRLEEKGLVECEGGVWRLAKFS